MGKRINFSAVFDDVHVCWVMLHVFPFCPPPLFHSVLLKHSQLALFSFLSLSLSLDTLIREQVVRNTVVILIMELAGLDCRVRCW